MNLFEEKEITPKKISTKKEKLKIIESDYSKKNYDYTEIFFENQDLFDNLTRLFAEGKLPNSLILESQSGQEKLTLAFNLAIKCISYSLNETSEKIYDQFNKDIISDILVIENENDKQILIEDIRKINNFISLKSQRGNPKFIIINSIDFLNINAANCLLKNLEEPAESVFFILLYDNLAPILKTILSRCIKLKIKNLSEESFKTLLKIKNYEIDENFDFYSNLSDNSPLLYNVFLENNLFQFYNKFINSLKRKDYNEFTVNFNDLNSIIKENNCLNFKKLIISKLFSKIFIEIYNKDLSNLNTLLKYKDYIDFLEKIFDKNLNLICYQSLL